MNHSRNVEIDSVANTTSDIEAAENDSQPMAVTTTFHYFLRLPAEIRMLIYDIIARTAFPKAGSLNLFKTSKLIRNEGAAASARYSIFELWFGWGGGVSTAHPPLTTLGSKATGLIQNVWLGIALTGGEWGREYTPRPFDCKQIEYFGGSEVMRGICHVNLYYGKKGYLSQDCASTLLFKALRNLIGFQFVRLRIDCGENQRILTTVDDHIMMISNTGKVDLYILRIKAALEPALGPSRRIPRISGQSQELEFRPFGWKPERCASIRS